MQLPGQQHFPHCYTVTVAFRDVDMLGVCNNAVYLSYFEDARLAFIRDSGLLPAAGVFSDGVHYVMARNEINYFASARHNDILHIYTRVTFIKNSSYGFEHLVLKSASGESVASGSGVVVRVDAATGRPALLSDEFIEKVKAFQGSVKLLRDAGK